MNPHKWHTYDEDDEEDVRSYEPSTVEMYQRGRLEEAYRARIGKALAALTRTEIRQNAELFTENKAFLKKPVKY